MPTQPTGTGALVPCAYAHGVRGRYPAAPAAHATDPPAVTLPTTPLRLVLLPGMDGTEILFRPLLAALPPWIAAETVTYPERGPSGYDDLLPLVAERVRAGPSCTLLGWSFSGPLALRAACLHSEQVRGVVLAASFVRPPSALLARLRVLVRGPSFGAVRLLRRLPVWLLRAPADPLRRDKALLWRRVPARTLAARARAVLRVDARDDLTRCPSPVLYLEAHADTVVPRRNLDAVLRARPDVRVVTAGRGHFALYSDAEASSRVVADFVRACALAAETHLAAHA